MLSSKNRLKKRKEFNYIYKKAQLFTHRILVYISCAPIKNIRKSAFRLANRWATVWLGAALSA